MDGRFSHAKAHLKPHATLFSQYCNQQCDVHTYIVKAKLGMVKLLWPFCESHTVITALYVRMCVCMCMLAVSPVVTRMQSLHYQSNRL